MKTICLLMAVIFTATILGCTEEEKGAGTGALIGAGVGAIVGHQSGEEKEGALIGGAVGALAGYTVVKIQKKKNAEGQVEQYVTCPQCESTLSFSEEVEVEAGDKIKCQKCGTQFELK